MGVILFLGCLVKNLGIVNVVCGAVSVFVFAGLFPGIIGHQLLKKPSIAMGSLISVCFVGMCLGLSFTDNLAGTLPQNCSWSLK